MMRCPHCHQSGISFFGKLWSGTMQPVRCRHCGKAFSLSPLTRWIAVGLRMELGLVALLLAMVSTNILPLLVYGGILIGMYLILGYWAGLKPAQKGRFSDSGSR